MLENPKLVSASCVWEAGVLSTLSGLLAWSSVPSNCPVAVLTCLLGFSQGY